MFTPSPAQKAFYDWVKRGSGHAVLEAVAGAGKTTTILNGIALMKGRVWLGVYNKKMFDEIKEKIASREDLRGRAFPHEAVFPRTFHAEGFAAVCRANGKDVDTKVDDKKVSRIVDAVIAEREGVEQGSRLDLRALGSAVVAIVGMAKNRGFVPPDAVTSDLVSWSDVAAWRDMVEHFDLGESLPEDADINVVIGFAREVLRRSTLDMLTVDFNDMVYLPLARSLRLYTYDWVLVDEAQDTNPTRRALAQRLMKPGARFVAVGDPRQAIFGFTGADNDSLEQIVERWKAKKLPLNVTYRCPKAIVAHAQQWVSHIEAHESAPEGEVSDLEYGNLVDVLKAVPATAYRDNAILCRYNKYLVALAFKLIRNGVPAKIEGRSIGDGLLKLATRWKSVKTLNGLETRLEEHKNKEVTKALAADREDRADAIIDQVDTLLVIMRRVRDAGHDRVDALKAQIEELFDDNVGNANVMTLCSAHKSKGLEWDNVYLLGRQAFMPSRMARRPWQVDQENNLIYVAVTRAKARLVEVEGVVDPGDKPADAEK